MDIEIVAIGNELLLGFTVDTNGSELGQALAAIGARVVRKTTVGDTQEAIRGAVSEALFRTGLHPEAPAGSLATKTGKPTEKAHRLADIIRDVLAEAVEAGGSTLRDHAQVDGSLGYFQHSFKVYDREGEACVTPACTGTVTRLVQSGRSTFYCPVCQKRSRA